MLANEDHIDVPMALFLQTMRIGNENDQVSKGHLVDALACTGDEGRDTLRKAVGSCE